MRQMTFGTLILIAALTVPETSGFAQIGVPGVGCEFVVAKRGRA